MTNPPAEKKESNTTIVKESPAPSTKTETNTTINMHIGSSSQMPSTSADAPAAVGSTLTFANSCFSLVEARYRRI